MTPMRSIIHYAAMPARWLQHALRKWPTNCPLCRLSASGGGLCPACKTDCFERRQARQVCRICARDYGCTTASDCNRPVESSLSCPDCQQQDPQISALVCALDDAFPAGLLLRDFRQAGQLQLAPVLADLMVTAAQRAWGDAMPDIWLPIPLGHAQVLKIGFSPTQQLTQAVARQTSVDWNLRWLRWAIPDDQTARVEFEASARVTGLTVGLVTDVVDTGTTVREAARALLAAGASRVMVLAAGCTPKASESGTIAPCLM